MMRIAKRDRVSDCSMIVVGEGCAWLVGMEGVLLLEAIDVSASKKMVEDSL